jgi:hypothetical protein
MMNKMMITAAAALALAAGNAHAQSQYGGVEDFYHANIEVDNAQYASRTVNPGYWLIDSNQWADVDSRWTGGGYVRLGISVWQNQIINGGGIPQKELAITYARQIGADVVIYTIIDASNGYGWTGHQVTFYAKQNVQRTAAAVTGIRRPTSAEATAAANRANDKYHQPHVIVRYDAQTDTYNWIGPTTGQPQSKSASWFLDQFTAIP